MGKHTAGVQRRISSCFNEVSTGMGRGRQHTMHRFLDAYMKNVYKGHMLTNDLGDYPVRHIREHKNVTWWWMIKDVMSHIRRRMGQMRTMEGRVTQEHEGLVSEIVGPHWRNVVENSKSCEEWMVKPKGRCMSIILMLISHQTRNMKIG